MSRGAPLLLVIALAACGEEAVAPSTLPLADQSCAQLTATAGALVQSGRACQQAADCEPTETACPAAAQCRYPLNHDAAARLRAIADEYGRRCSGSATCGVCARTGTAPVCASGACSY